MAGFQMYTNKWDCQVNTVPFSCSLVICPTPLPEWDEGRQDSLWQSVDMPGTKWYICVFLFERETHVSGDLTFLSYEIIWAT